MTYNVISIPPFDNQLKRLSKKYPSLKKEFRELFESLEKIPFQGNPLGDNCFKIRLAISSKGKGKSGGARIITCVRIIQSSVFLITIYDKSERRDIGDKELKRLLSFIDPE